MASDLKKQLTDRFAKGIRKTFTPCPLIGPKWMQEFPKGKPADFRFFGMRKLAKATGRPLEKVVQLVMRNVTLDGLGVEWDIKQGCLIDINRVGKAAPSPGDKPTQPQTSSEPKADQRSSFRGKPKHNDSRHSAPQDSSRQDEQVTQNL